jgi:pentatricopeptide repeat protein
MKEEGISADRVAYNALFSALRVAGDAEKAFELWGEMCGTRSFLSTASIATAKGSASPDIITVTDCIATLYRAGRINEVNQVFQEAVDRGIFMRGNNLDSQWETDISGMTLPVASAACRYILKQTLELQPNDFRDITFITGVGKAQEKQRGKEIKNKRHSEGKRRSKTSLRDYIQDLLKREFDPPLESYIPQRAQGTVVVRKASLIEWKNRQRHPAGR